MVWEKVGQGPTELSVGADGGRLDFSLACLISLSLSLSLGDGLIKTEILSQRTVKPNTTNQPIKIVGMKFLFIFRLDKYPSILHY